MGKRELAVVILAAGRGVRMKSDLPKVLHKLGSHPLIEWVVKSAQSLQPSRIVAVVGYGAEQVKSALKDSPVYFAHQTEQLGTAHALLQAKDELEGFEGGLVVLSGDVPMIREETLKNLVKLYDDTGSKVAFLSTEIDDPSGYGRVVRDERGEVAAIVEEKGTDAKVREIKEINGGIYLFDKKFLFDCLPKISADNEQKEFYLTDIIGIALSGGQTVSALKLDDAGELRGANRPEDIEAMGDYLLTREGNKKCQV